MKNGQSRSSCSLEIPVTDFIEESKGLSFRYFDAILKLSPFFMNYTKNE